MRQVLGQTLPKWDGGAGPGTVAKMNTTYALSPFIDRVTVRVGKGQSPLSNGAASKMMTMFVTPERHSLKIFSLKLNHGLTLEMLWSSVVTSTMTSWEAQWRSSLKT